MVSPRYRLLPEASRIKPTIYKVFAGLFRCGQCSCGLLVWRGRTLGTFFNVERRCRIAKGRLKILRKSQGRQSGRSGVDVHVSTIVSGESAGLTWLLSGSTTSLLGLRDRKGAAEYRFHKLSSFFLNHYSPGDFLSTTPSTSGRFAFILTFFHSFGFRSAFSLLFSLFLDFLACGLLGHGCALA
jgi:hypothetical protein